MFPVVFVWPSLSLPVPGAAASVQVLDNVPTPTGSILTPSSISSCSRCASIPCPLLVNTVLSFIKAYRLRGDNDSLKRVVLGRFSTEEVEVILRLLVCHSTLIVTLTDTASCLLTYRISCKLLWP